jgi:HD-like signal output (HDOD) protein
MSDQIESLLKKVGELPPLPQVAQKALSLIRNQNSNMSDLAEVLVMDQGLTSAVLKWVNSSYYGITKSVSTVQQAVVLLGQETVQSLVLAASISTYLYKPVPGYDLDKGDLWKHSIGVATGAQFIAKRFGPSIAEEAYHAGLMCDLGKLAFESLFRKINMSQVNWQGRTFTDLEMEVFGIDHARMGAEMANHWKLPIALQKGIEFHHNPGMAGEYIQIASAVHIVDIALTMLGIGIGKDGLRYNIDPIAFEVTGWSVDRMPDLFGVVMEQVKSAEEFIGVTATL